MRIVPKRQAARAVLGAVLALAVSGCATGPRVESSWSAPGPKHKPYRSLVIFGIAPKPVVRRAYEDGFVAKLREQGVKARPGYSFMTEAGQGDAKAIKRAAHQAGADAAVVAYLVGKGGPSGSAGDIPTPGPNAQLADDYARAYATVSAPGYYATYPDLQLQASLYDVASGALQWSGRSGPMDPSSEHTTINEPIQAMVAAMAAAGYLPRGSAPSP